MNVTPPSDVIEKSYGHVIKPLVDRIEKQFSTRQFCEQRGGEHLVKFYLEDGEWFEDIVKHEIERMYVEAGWLSVSFRSDYIEFTFKPRQEPSDD